MKKHYNSKEKVTIVNGATVTEKGNKIYVKVDPLAALKSDRNFNPKGIFSSVHKSKKGKGSYKRKQKYKDSSSDNNSSCCSFFII